MFDRASSCYVTRISCPTPVGSGVDHGESIFSFLLWLFRYQVAPNSKFPGLRPGPRWESLQRSLRPPGWWEGSSLPPRPSPRTPRPALCSLGLWLRPFVPFPVKDKILPLPQISWIDATVQHKGTLKTVVWSVDTFMFINLSRILLFLLCNYYYFSTIGDE